MSFVMKKLGLEEANLVPDIDVKMTDKEKAQLLKEQKYKDKRSNIIAYKYKTSFSKFNKDESSMRTLNSIP